MDAVYLYPIRGPPSSVNLIDWLALVGVWLDWQTSTDASFYAFWSRFV